MKCENCPDWLRLEIKQFNQKINNVAVTINNLPVLICPTCNTEYFHDKSEAFVTSLVEQAKKNKKRKISSSLNLEKERKRYGFCTQVNFVYDSLDYEYIPGLVRPSEDGFLTPVFFKIEVLIKYLNHPEYSVEFASNTYGSIYHNHEHMISLGINRNNRVIMWLGDIDHLPENEQYYLRSENIDSDHDIASEFYRGQIEVEFTDLSNENELLKLRSEFEKYCYELFRIKIYQLDMEVVKIMKDIKKPIVWTENEVGKTIQAINKVFVESINCANLKRHINKLDPKFKTEELRSNKLFVKWINLNFPELTADEVMKPFFILYDYRQIFSHLLSMSESKKIMNSCFNRLDLPKNERNHEKLYAALIEQLQNSLKKLIGTMKVE